jgi:hypothetical protein
MFSSFSNYYYRNHNYYFSSTCHYVSSSNKTIYLIVQLIEITEWICIAKRLDIPLTDLIQQHFCTVPCQDLDFQHHMSFFCVHWFEMSGGCFVMLMFVELLTTTV